MHGTDWLWLAPLLSALWLVKLGVQAIVMNEYRSWAPSLAERLVWLAGKIYRERQAEWQAEFESIRADDGSGLGYASTLLRAAVLLNLRSRRVRTIETPADAWRVVRLGLSMSVVTGVVVIIAGTIRPSYDGILLFLTAVSTGFQAALMESVIRWLWRQRAARRG